MTAIPHSLAAEFPEKVETMHALRESDAHFAKLCDEYSTLNELIYKAEANLQPTEELHEVQMRKQRMMLKDQIWSILASA